MYRKYLSFLQLLWELSAQVTGRRCVKSMKKELTVILFAFLLLLSSCKAVEYYEYVHKPTAQIKDCLWNSAYKKAKCLKDENLVLIPDFRAFSPSFSIPQSRLIVCSKNNKPIWISKAILRVKGEKTETTLKLSKEFPYREPTGKTGYHIVWILLFDEKNTEYSKYEMKNNLELEIHYSPSRGEPNKTEFFEINLKKRKDVAWPT